MRDRLEEEGFDPLGSGSGRPEAELRLQLHQARTHLALAEARCAAAERKGAEAEKAERRYRDLVEGLDGSIVWEADASTHAMTFVSARAQDLLGFETHRWLEEPRFFLARVHAADRGRILGACQRAVLERTAQTCLHRAIASDGRVLWFQTAVHVVEEDGGCQLRGLSVDITERKRTTDAQRFLAQASALLGASLEYPATWSKLARLAVPRLADWCLVDELAAHRSVLPVAAAHSVPSKERIAVDIRRRHPVDLGAAMGVGRVLRTGQSELYPDVAHLGWAARALGSEHRELLRRLGARSYMIVPLVARGQTFGAISFLSAESGRRFATSDLALAEDFARRAGLAIHNARLYAEAHRAVRLREEILAVVSHDLRNPLATIRLAAASLTRGDLAERGRKQGARIHAAVDRMEHMIHDLLDLASIQAGHLSVDRRTHEVALLVREAIDALGPLANAKSLRLEARVPDAVLWVSCDRDRIQQLYSNLVGNAIKFTPAGGMVTLDAVARDGFVELAVGDTGPGIPAEQLGRIFERYWQASSTQRAGIGLGLAISKGIVDAHGGRIWATSAPGAGCCIHFTLQASRPVAQAPMG